MKIGIIGGGASGLTAAYFAAGYGHEVFLFEQKDKIGKKLLATGNGRCNITNTNIAKGSLEHYLGDAETIERLKKLFSVFGYSQTVEFFNSIGIELRNKGELVYPYTEQASTVVEALKMAVEERNVDIITNASIAEITRESKGFRLKAAQDTYIVDRVIVATGGKAQPKLGSNGSGYELVKKLGHTITRVTPGLVQFRCNDKCFKSLAGVRVKARASLLDADRVIYSEDGEVQLTAYGLSGILCMNLSNRIDLCKGKKSVTLDILPEYEVDSLRELLFKRKDIFGQRYTSELLLGLVPNKLDEVIINKAEISTHVKIGSLITGDIERLISCLKSWKIDIDGTNTFEEAQISLGGVPLGEIEDSMESCLVPGLYITGEILNLHGDCGGYNLQLCWTSGAIAGMNAGQ